MSDLVEVWLLTVDGDYSADSYVFATEEELTSFLVSEYEYDLANAENPSNVPAWWAPATLPLDQLRRVTSV